jgi:hypothetical protein
MTNSLFRFSVIPAILAICLVLACGQQEKESDVTKKAEPAAEMEEIPAVIMATLMSKFPSAEIQKWTKEQEGDIMVYDIEFRQAGQKFEADIKEDGTIHNWERQITAEDLPEAVLRAVINEHPEVTFREIMLITAVTDGVDELEGYEILFETPDSKAAEIMVSPEGEILEDTGEGE